MSDKRIQISDMPAPAPSLPEQMSSLIDAAAPSRVWVPADFSALGSRDAIDKALQRLASTGQLRRIDRGLYDRPQTNRLTGKPTVPDYREVLDAMARRDQLRMLVDGITAANDLGLTHAVPSKVTIHTDARRRSIQLGNLIIEFKQTAPSRLYWAGRPAMRLVQALHWLKDTLPSDRQSIQGKVAALLEHPGGGQMLRDDLQQGFHLLPTWMQEFLRSIPALQSPVASRATQREDAPADRSPESP